MNIKEWFRLLVVRIVTLQAKAILKKYKPKVIEVTGSVGKTSTKDAVYTALSDHFFVRKSEKSFNSDVGVPLTILGVPNGWANPVQWLRNIVDGFALLIIRAPYPKWLVVEVGADRPGDISKSLTWLVPNVVVATRFPDVSVHVEYYDSKEAVIEEELSPARLLASGGTYVFNGDDENASAFQTAPGVKRISYGLKKEFDVHASRFHVSTHAHVPTGISFDIHAGNEKVHIILLGVIGQQQVYSTLAGVAVAISQGLTLEKAVKAFATHESPAGRMKIILGTKHSTLIDDTYNASPVATEEALKALKDVPRVGRRIAVLADMMELGSFSVSEHERIGKMVLESADMLVTVGVRARGIAEGALSSGMDSTNIFQFERGADAMSHLLSVVGEGDVVLIKGSQSMRMERVVKSLMAEPEKAKDLLVRQDAEWLMR